MRPKYLVKVDGRRIPGLPDSVQKEIVRACKAIRRRTHWQGWYHMVLGQIQFHPGDRPMGGSVSETLFQNGRWLRVGIDDVCRKIESVRMPRRRKEQLVERSMKIDAEMLEAEQRRVAENLKYDLKDVVGFYARRIENRHSNRVFVMSANA